jgi:hypothetical protein
MKKVNFFLFTLLIIGSGCNKNAAYIEDLRKFVTDVELNCKDYSIEEWRKKDKEFIKLSETRFHQIREKLTPQELSGANKLIGTYKALKLKQDFVDFKTGIEDSYEQDKSMVKELLPDSAEVKDAIDKGINGIKDLLHDSI